MIGVLEAFELTEFSCRTFLFNLTTDLRPDQSEKLSGILGKYHINKSSEETTANGAVKRHLDNI